MTDTRYFTTGDGSRIAYQLDGAEGLPVLVLSNSIATNFHMWGPPDRSAYRVVPDPALRFFAVTAPRAS